METNSIKEKLYGFHKSSWIDISDKELIIYGAGQGCLDMENELELSSIFSVVDGKEELIGRKIMLLSREYTIESPAILNELDNNRYCVIISSEKYYEEIKADIKRRYSCSLNIFLWKTEIRYGYSTIDELCYLDPLFRRKLSDAHLIRKANEIICCFTDFISMHPDLYVDIFMSEPEGQSKVSFIFGNNTTKWIFHYKGLVNSKSSFTIERENRTKSDTRENYVRRHGLERDLSIYKNGNICVQRYVNNRIDFADDNNLKLVMNECRMLHRLPTENLPDIDFEKIFYSDFCVQIDTNHIESMYLEMVRNLGDKCVYILKETKTKNVIHGDLTKSNTVEVDGRLRFIDWEYLSVGIPEIDVCYFTYSISFDLYLKGKVTYDVMIKKCLSDLKKNMAYYYGNAKCDKQRDRLAMAILMICILRDMLQSYLFDKEKGDYKARIFLKLMEKGELPLMQEIVVQYEN